MYRIVWVVALASMGLVGGCGADGEMASGLSCVEGQSLACICDDGRSGAQSCSPDGTYGGCVCDTPPTSSAGTAGTTAGARDPTAGAGGVGGSGEPAAGEAGEAGAAGTPPQTGGAGGEPGGEAGRGGGEPSGRFGYCEVDDDCEGDRQCLMGGGTTGYCADTCSGGFAIGMASQCEAPEGGVPINCGPLTGLCTLGDCVGDGLVCPGEMHCIETPPAFGIGQPTGQCRYGD